jgi:tetratricopeptide (TPR) repeat protein
MLKSLFYYVLLLCVVGLNFSYSQQNTIDSLKQELKKKHHDTIKAYILSEIADSDDPEWVKYNDELKSFTLKKLSQSISEKEKKYYNTKLGLAYIGLGYLEQQKGNPLKAIENYNMAISIQKKVNDLSGLATSYNNLAEIFKQQGNIPKSLDYHHQSLKIKEKLNNKQGIATSLNNIGLIYLEQRETEKAKENIARSLKIEKSIKSDKIAITYHNMGLIYYNEKNYSKSLEYYLKSLNDCKKQGNSYGIAFSLNNIGNVYEMLGQEKEALDNFLKSLKLRETLEDKSGISASLNNIANLYFKIKNFVQAYEFATKSLQLAQELGYPERIKNAAKLLMELYRKRNDNTGALKMYDLFVLMKDSIYNQENRKNTIKQQLNYEYDKKETILKAEQEKRNIIHATESKRQRIIIIAVIIGLIVLIVFLVIVYNRFQVTKKQKEIISLKEQETQRQKEIVEEKNKEILDSITYAKRIQTAILPQPKLVKEYIKNSFILYKPKDIVAGDFYWFEIIDDTIFFAAADCTGHGVPGAMVSVVCHNALNRAVREFKLKEPGKILDKTRDIVVSEFGKSNEDVKDGMDISIAALKFDPNNENKLSLTKLYWAGANNPLWILRERTLIEYRPDKQPIGRYTHSTVFQTHEIEIFENDEIYIFTDGFQDQFGGEHVKTGGKKFKTSKMREMFLKYAHVPMEEKKIKIDEEFENWKGELEQLDDVCVIGIKV